MMISGVSAMSHIGLTSPGTRKGFWRLSGFFSTLGRGLFAGGALVLGGSFSVWEFKREDGSCSRFKGIGAGISLIPAYMRRGERREDNTFFWPGRVRTPFLMVKSTACHQMIRESFDEIIWRIISLCPPCQG
jgi:hypothetical protein